MASRTSPTVEAKQSRKRIIERIGTVMGKRGPKSQPERVRFEQFVDRSDTDACWLWTGYRDRKGYGQMNLTRDGVRTARKAHRVSWELHHEVQLTPEQCVLHHCDNPSCVRVDHLFIGTVATNNLDRALKGRYENQSKTQCPQGHPYDLMRMRKGRSFRACSICHRDARRRAERKSASAA